MSGGGGGGVGIANFVRFLKVLRFQKIVNIIHNLDILSLFFIRNIIEGLNCQCGLPEDSYHLFLDLRNITIHKMDCMFSNL